MNLSIIQLFILNYPLKNIRENGHAFPLANKENTYLHISYLVEAFLTWFDLIALKSCI